MIKPSPEQIKAWIKENFGSDYKVARRGEEIRINNPFSSDDSYHLWINLKKGLVKDWRPSHKDVAGTFISFVMRYKEVNFKSAITEVMGRNVDFYSSNNETIEKLPKLKSNEISLPEGFNKLTYEDNKISSIIKKYLNNRCIKNGKIYVLGVGYCNMNIVFPYYENKKVVYWQQRSITNKMFLFPENSVKSDFIYGIDHIDPSDPVIITESIFNALMFDNALAIGGSDLSDNQKTKLRKLGIKKIIFAFDNDEAGLAGTVKAYEKLNAYFDLFYSITDGDSDWNDLAIKKSIDEPIKILKKNLKKLNFKECVNIKRKFLI